MEGGEEGRTGTVPVVTSHDLKETIPRELALSKVHGRNESMVRNAALTLFFIFFIYLYS